MSFVFKRTVHPAVTFVWFILVCCFTIAIRHPLYSAASLVAAVMFNILKKNRTGIKILFWLVPFFVLLSCLNPLVSHWGNTTLFTIFGNPFTKEAFFYGLNMGLTFAVMVEWFSCISFVMTADKITYLFAPFFPSVSLMMTMILRLINLISHRAKQIREARKGMGLNNSVAELNAVLSSTLEEGVYTARTMEDRGFGKTKRTSFISYSFTAFDFAELLIIALLSIIIIFGIKEGCCRIDFYPELSIKNINSGIKALGVFAGFLIFSLVPVIETFVNYLRWGR